MLFHEWLLWLVLVLLIVISGFFSSAETAMMSLNRYRLRSRVRKGDESAERVAALLKRPDRLLGVILLGNTFANVLASAVATLLAVTYFGEIGLLLSTIILTIVILIFSETAPKTLAALHPEQVAYPYSIVLRVLLKLFYPLVWFITLIANALLKLFHVRMHGGQIESLTFDEFRMLVHESNAHISNNYQTLLLRILDLEKVTIEHVMVPIEVVYAISLEDPWEVIESAITQSTHAYVPVYAASLDVIVGVLNIRKALCCLVAGNLDLPSLKRILLKPYFVPSGAELSQQLVYFRQTKIHLAIVTDEYGDIQGVVTLNDILEEVVGEFTSVPSIGDEVQHQRDGSILIDGSVNILDLNRQEGWHLPIGGPKTLSGLLIEELEMIPEAAVGLRVAGYPMEIEAWDHNRITLIRVWPQLRQ